MPVLTRVANSKRRIGGALLVIAMIGTLVGTSGTPVAAAPAPANQYVAATVSAGVPSPTTALSAADCALLIQMTGTVADGLGVHEILDPATASPTRSYSNTEAVQYVVMPGGCGQEVDIDSTYAPPPWDPSTGTGGVVFLGGTTLNLAADIDASASGFASSHSVGAGCDGTEGGFGPDISMWEGGSGGGGIFGGGGGAAGHVAHLPTWGPDHEFDGAPGGGGTATAGGAGAPNGDNIGFSPDGGDAGCVGNGGGPDQSELAGQFYSTGAGAGGGGSYGGGGGACSSRSSGAYSGGGGGGGSYTGGGAGGWGGTNTGWVSPEEPGFAGNAANAATISTGDHYLHVDDARVMMGGAGGASFRGDGSGPYDGGRGGGVVVLVFDAVVGAGGSVISNGGEGSTPPNFSGEGSHGASGSGGGAGGQIRVASPSISDAFFSAAGGIGGQAVEDTSSNSQPHTGSAGATGGGGGIWFDGVGPDASNTGANAGATSGDATLTAPGLANVDWAVNGGNHALGSFPAGETIGSQTYTRDQWAAIVAAANLDSQATFKPIALSLVDASAGGFTLEELVVRFPSLAQPNNPKNLGLGCGPGIGGNGLAVVSLPPTPPATFGDYVWLDADKDGIQDPTEVPLEGVVVTLETGASTTTAADGSYSFEVDPGTDQVVSFDPTEAVDVDGSALLLSPVDEGVDDEADSDALDVAGTATISLTAGETDTINGSYDVGFYLPNNRIGNLVWFDANNNAIVDQGEPGVAGLTVELYKEDGTTPGLDAADELFATTATDAEGVYWFDYLPEDMTYYVALPEDQTASTVSVDGASVDPSTLLSSTGGDLTNNDDDNGDDGEPVAGFIAVSGPADVGAGTEPVAESDTNTDPATDSEDYIETAGAADLNDDDSNLTVDLGLIQEIRIGNLVWLDGETGEAGFNNGTADPAEAAYGLGGVAVELYLDDDATAGLSEADTLIGEQTTSATGEYWFAGLAPGTYVIGIPEGQTGQTIDGETVDVGELFSSTAPQSSADAGLDDEDDGQQAVGFAATSAPFDLDYFDNPVDEAGNFGSAVDGEQEASANAVTLGHPDNNSDLSFDFGFVELPSYRLGNLIWWDVDNNGLAEDGEPGIKDVEVELWVDGGESALAATTTNADGQYWFEDLLAGDYYVVVPDGQTGQMIGDDNIDLADLTIASSQVSDPDDPTDTDNDNDGTAAVGAVGQPATSGVVSLGDPDQFSPSEPTNETVRTDDTTDDDTSATATSLPDAQSNLTVDIGYVMPLRVGNVIWLDNGGTGEKYRKEAEDNGRADPSESGLNGVLVQLLDVSGNVVAETLTDPTGTYVFDSLAAGTFRVAVPVDQVAVLDEALIAAEGVLDGLRSSAGRSVAAEDADDDDDGEPAEGYASISAPFDLAYGAESAAELGDFTNETSGAAEAAVNELRPWLPDGNSNLLIDLGFAPVPTFQLGNLLWEDLDNDGVAEAGEPGIAGVLLVLLDESGQVIAETVTDEDGHYLFTDLPAGDYRVLVPADQTPYLAEPQPGIVPRALDGLKTSGPAVAEPDVPADIDNDSNALVETTLPGGFTTGVLTLGEGTGQDEPVGETLRSDDPTADEDGSLRDDRSNLTVDLGLWRGLRLGNQVFLDGEQSDPGYNNGVFDDGEVGIGGVSVFLFIDDGDGVFEPDLDDEFPVQVAVTDDEGNYAFEGLDAGTPYIVAIQTMPEGYSSTGKSVAPSASDNDDDGSPAGGYASVSDAITLTTGDATAGEADTVPAEDAEAEANENGAVYPDANSELSVDFGFVRVPLYRIGNLVWDDVNGDGVVGEAEPGIEGALVQLLDGSGDVIAETLTDADGQYAFENLLAGTYRIQIPVDQNPTVDTALEPLVEALDGFVSSTNGEEADANDDVDNNDNGLGEGDWVSSDVSLGSDTALPVIGTEPVDETNIANGTDDDPDAGIDGSYPDSQSNYSVDFGFYRLTLGNQVWFDTNDNGVVDDDEAGIAGVAVNLYEVTEAAAVLVDTVDTDEAGLYLFAGLAADTSYVVEVDESNFAAGAPLEDLFSSTDPGAGPVDPDGDEAIPNDGIDSDDNGADPATNAEAVSSLPLTLFNGDEPFGEAPTSDGQGDDGNGNLSVDFGFHNGLRLGSLVWLDDTNNTVSDENGIADETESGLDGVSIELYLDDGSTPGALASDDTLVATTETADGGLYEFGHLEPGSYFVLIPQSEFDLGGDLAGHTSTLDGAADEATNNDDDGVVSADADETGVVAGPITLAPGEEPIDEGNSGTTGTVEEDGTYGDANSNLTIDFGLVETPLYRIGNLVWEDLDDDGVAEAGEPGLPGVLVQLLDGTGDVVAEAVTNEAGRYSFDQLEAGDYVVRVPSDQTPTFDLNLEPLDGAVDGLVSSDNGEELDANDDVDNNDNGLGTSDWATAPVTVGEAILGGEPTDETLRVDDPSDDDIDGGTDGQSGPDARSNYSIDFGFYRLTLGNQVWFDIDGDGIADDGEPGLNGVAVELYEQGEADELTLVATTETETVDGADGIYSFDGLSNGSDYVVAIPAEELAEGGPLYGTYSSPDPVGGVADPDGDDIVPAADGDDSGQDPATLDTSGDVVSLPVTLTVGDEPVGEDPTADDAPDTNSNLTVDFGFVGLSIGNSVWLDADGDGVQDDEESGVEDVVVELWPADESGEPIGDAALEQTVTGVDGTYNFVGLEPGDYVVRVAEENFEADAVLAGWISTAGNGVSAPDPDDDVDADDNGDPSPEDGWVQAPPISIDFGTEPGSGPGVDATGTPTSSANSTLDFGFVPTPPMSIGNAVWIDANNSGTMDPDEVGMADVRVELHVADENGQPSDGDPVATATTDAEGNYLFPDVAPGEYVVVIPASNFDDSEDSLFGFASSSATAPTDPDDDVDSDDDGIDPINVGEQVLSQAVLLYPTLEPRDEDLGAEGHGTTDDGPIEDRDSNLTVDFGFYSLSLGSRVFFDTDNSGTMDEGEDGLADVVVHLVDAEGDIIASTTTDDDGEYLFSGFAEGDYQVMIDESNFVDGAPLASTYSSTGNDVAGAGGVDMAPDADDVVVDNDDNGQPEDGHNSALWTEPVTVSVGDEPITGVETDTAEGFTDVYDANSNLTVDFGVYSASLALPVWIDENGNNLVDAGEELLDGVIINLLDAEDGDEVVGTAASDDDGSLQFDGMPEGSYKLEVVAENFAPDGVLEDTPVPSEPIVSAPFDLRACDCESGGVALEVVADLLAFAGSATIGDKVWSDADGDGIQDAGEPGLAGVEITLLDEAGTVVATTTSGTDGSYSIDNVPAGSYFVEFGTPSGFTASPSAVGADRTADSDPDPATGRTSLFTVTATDSPTGIDAGFVPDPAPATPTVAAPSGPLAFTGGGARLPLGLGFVLVFLGMAMVAATRKRGADR